MGTLIAVRMTATDFDALPDDGESKRELIDGEVFEMASGGPVHERVKSNAHREVVLWGGREFDFLVQSETRYYLNEIDIYQPDVSIVLGSTLDPQKRGKITIAPVVAIEIVSSEPAARLQHKIKAMLAAGTRVVVVVYPEERSVFLYRTGRVEQLSESDTLALDDVLPGFAVPVSALFQGI